MGTDMANIEVIFLLSMAVHIIGSACGSNKSLDVVACQHLLFGNPLHVPEKPLKIYVGGVVQVVAPLIQSETEFSIHMKLVLKWKETGRIVEGQLRENIFREDVEVEGISKKLRWIPCPYIVNAKFQEIKTLSRQLINVINSPGGNGEITMIMVVDVTLDCAMNFQWYPVDQHVCPMRIESCLYDDAYVDYNWIKGNKAFKVVPKRLLQFDLEHSLEYFKSRSFKGSLNRNFSQISVNFRFQRIWSNHLIQAFVPCSLIVSTTFFSFSLSLDATSARGLLLTTSSLTLATQFLSLRSTLPPTAYIKAVDIWMLVCLVVVIFATGEFALVKFLFQVTQHVVKENSVQVIIKVPSREKEGGGVLFQKHSKDKRKRRLGSVPLSGRSTATNHLPSRLEWVTVFGRVPLIWTSTEPSGVDEMDENVGQKNLLWKQIDVISTILFPLLFFTFSFVYWIILIIICTRGSSSE